MQRIRGFSTNLDVWLVYIPTFPSDAAMASGEITIALSIPRVLCGEKDRSVRLFYTTVAFRSRRPADYSSGELAPGQWASTGGCNPGSGGGRVLLLECFDCTTKGLING